MLRNASVRGLAVAIVLVFTLAGPLIGPKASPPSQTLASSPLGTAFTYQGHLTEAGEPANGLYDLSFALYDEAQAGSQIGPTLDMSNVAVAEGLFAVELDFGPVYDGSALWLEIGVRAAGDTAPYDTLLPRQRLTAAPYAIHAMGAPWSGLLDVPPGFDDQVDNDTLADLVCTSDQVATWSGSTWVCSDATGSAGWSLTGNAGTTPGTHYLGTTDDQPLQLRVNQALALRLEPDAISPNVIGGYGGNSVAVGVSGASIGGGGRDLALNQVTADFARIGGGAGNLAGGYASILGGGENNAAGGSYGVVAGGASNTASGPYAVVVGGQTNAVTATHALIGGGGSNQVTGAYGVVGGGSQNHVTAEHASIGGGSYNLAVAAFGTIAGGGPSDPGNPTTTNNRVVDAYGTIAGGGGNLAGTDDAAPEAQPYAAVGGGMDNVAGGAYATVSGGSANAATGYGAAVAGGVGNVAPASYAWVGAGSGNQANNNYAAVGGGSSNHASANYATIGGGGSNIVTGAYGTIPGGAENQVTASFGLAAGYGAHADHQGSFVWSSSGTGFATTAPSQFLIDASGGVGIGTSSPTHMLTVAGDASIQSGRAISVGLLSEMQFVIQAPGALYARGDLLYVTAYATNTLSIWNVADPAAAALISYTTSDLSGPSDMQVAGDRVYIVSKLSDSLVILDTADTSAIDSIGSTDEGLANPVALHVSGKYAYVASHGASAPPGLRDGLAVFDVTDPSRIALASFTSTHLAGTSDVSVSGGYAYVTSQDNNRLVAFDVSDPRQPTALGYTSASLATPVQVHVSGIYAYVVSRDNDSLVIFDASNPGAIVPLDQITTGLVRPISLHVAGDRAYVAYQGEATTGEQCGLAILDVSDPTDVAVLNVIDMTTWLKLVNNGTVEEPRWELVPPKPKAISTSGNRLYLANERHNSVAVFEIDHLETTAAHIGTLKAANLEVTDEATVARDLAVGGGLSVGARGALIDGAISVAGSGDSHIAGALSIGGAGALISDTVLLTRTLWIPAPTHALDIIGEARIRVNDYVNLAVRSPNAGADEDAYIDLIRSDQTSVLTPTARIEFDAADPFTHTTSIRFHTRGAADADMMERLEIAAGGDLRPAADNQYALGDPGHRWTAVYAVGGVIEGSDARLKEDVIDLCVGVDELRRLRPISFTWRASEGSARHYGFIAQEVQDVLPDVVVTSEGNDGMLGMRYTELVPVLVAAIQDQQAQLDAQAAKISAMEARLAALEANEGRASGPAWQGMLQHLWLGSLALGAAVLAGRQWLGSRP